MYKNTGETDRLSPVVQPKERLRNRGRTERMEIDGDSIMFCAGKKPDLCPGRVERSWAGAVGSGVPAPPVWAQGRWGWAAQVGLKP